jgi:hypothetical protein
MGKLQLWKANMSVSRWNLVDVPKKQIWKMGGMNNKLEKKNLNKPKSKTQ